MRKVFTGLFVGVLVLVFCCPLMGGEMQPEFGGTEVPRFDEDSGLTWYQIAGLLAALGTSTALGWQGCKKMNAIRIEPQPLEVQMSKDYVTRSEFEDYRKQVGGDFERVHKRLDTVMPAVAEIKGEMHRMAVVQEKILELFLNRKVS